MYSRITGRLKYLRRFTPTQGTSGLVARERRRFSLGNGTVQFFQAYDNQLPGARWGLSKPQVSQG